MPITISGKRRKNADRLGGIELMIPWPADLPEPVGLAEDEERDASSAEKRWVRAQLGDLALLDLTCTRVSAAIVRRPPCAEICDHGQVRPHLAAVIIGRRWIAATERNGKLPLIMWA